MKTYHDLTKALANPEDVKELSLPKHKIKSLPEEIGTLKNVEKINLAYNSLRDLPASFAQLSQLKHLKLGSNNLHQIPEVLLQMPQIEFLNVRRNRLKHLPENIDKIQGLTTLIAYANQIKTLPENITKLACLTKLDLSENYSLKLATVSNTLANMPQKFALKIRSLGLRQLPSNFAQLQNLQHLDISENIELDIEALLELLTYLPQCTYLNLKSTQTKLPKAIEALSYLEGLSVNQLEGNQHIDWDKFTCLKQLDISCNRLREVPKWVLKLEELENLNLRYNVIGALPVELLQLKKLKHLNISENEFHTPPVFLTQMLEQLETLELKYTEYIGNNKLSHFYQTAQLIFNWEKERKIAQSVFAQSIEPGQVAIKQLLPFLWTGFLQVHQYVLNLIARTHPKNPLPNLPKGSKIGVTGSSKRFTLARLKKAAKKQGWQIVKEINAPVDCLIITEKPDHIHEAVWQNPDLHIITDEQWQQWATCLVAFA